MSNPTKILIVLLTLSSIFLCGIVVTYVGNSENYRKKYNELKSERDGLNSKVRNLTKKVNEKTEEMQQAEDKLAAEISSLREAASQAQNSLKDSEREKSLLLQKVSNFASEVDAFRQTNEQQGLLLQKTLEELNTLRAEQIKERKELTETTTSLIEKMAIIETLEAEKRQLIEEKFELQSRLGEVLQPTGRTVTAAVPVTQRPETARAAAPAVGVDTGLKGLVTKLDLKNSLASVSIGSADGVREGMKFHVTRGDEFVCDILIIDTDTEEAVGVLDLVQQQPRIGDNVSTNL